MLNIKKLMSMISNKIISFFVIFLMLIVFVELQSFYLIDWPEVIDWIVYSNRIKWSMPIIICFSIFCWKIGNHSILAGYGKYVPRLSCAVAISVICLSVHALVVYQLTPLITIYGLGCRYLYVFLAIPLIYLFEQDNGFENTLAWLTKFTSVMYASIVVNCVYYIITDDILFSALLNSDSWLREGKLRISAGAFAWFLLIYNFYRIYILRTKKHMYSSFAILALGVMHMLVSGQSRIALVAFFACIAVIVLLETIQKRRLAWISLGLFAGVGILMSNRLVTFLESFAINGSTSASTTARIGAVQHYWSAFLSNPFFAIGFAGSDQYGEIVHGISGKYHYNDVGFMGLLAQTGLFCIIIYVIPFVRMAWIAYVLGIKQKSKQGILLVAIVCYLFLTSFTLIVTDDARVILFPFLIAMFEYSYRHKESPLKTNESQD